MKVKLSLEEIKESKKGNELCPSCGSVTDKTTISEDGEEIPVRKCSSNSCFWWGQE